MLSLEMFGFKALWSPFFFIAVLLVIGAYFLLTIKYRTRFKKSERLTTKQGTYFVIGMITLYAIKGSPLDLMGHLMFYAHMIQMAVLYLIVPQLLIVGIPQWIWRSLLEINILNQVFRFFTKPIIALILFNGMFSFYHIPLIFDVIKTDMWLHAVYTTVLFIMAIFMWWPLVNQIEEHGKLTGLKKLGYIFADGVLLTPACALIIFADSPMYATFSDPSAWMEALALCVSPAILATLNLSGPEMFSSMSLLHDQQLGGVLMKIIQEIVYGVVLYQVFYAWYRKEQEDADTEKEQHLNTQFVK